MKFWSYIKSIRNLFPKPPVHTKRELRELESSIVARYAQGNTSLQAGDYITYEDAEDRKKRVTSYSY